MSRLLILIALILAVVIMNRFHDGKYSFTDAFNLLELEEMRDEEAQETAVKPEEIAVLIDPVASENELKDFFSKLKLGQYKNIIVLGENSSWRGDYTVNTPETNEELVLLAGDSELKMGLSKDFFKSAKELEKIIVELKSIAGNVVIFPLAIKDIATKEEMEKLAKTIDELDGETLVIAATSFTQNMPNIPAKFHDELSKNVLLNLDINAVEQMDVGNVPMIYFLLSYLNEKEVNVEITDEETNENSTGIFATFKEGHAEKDRDLTIMAFGDIMLSRHVRTLMNSYGHDYIFENIKGFQNRFFKGADVVFGNLEGPIKGVGTSGGTAMVFGFHEDSAPLLKNYGFTLLSLANNHALDKGWDGRETTIAALEKNNLGWCGHPSEEDPNSVYYDDVGDKKYAFVCLQDITARIDQENAVKLIQEVRPNVDYLIVTVHWGYEYKQRADYKLQIEPGRAYVDAGADLVIGHHPHVVQNFEIYNGRLIFYSIGNFIFDQYWSIMTQEQLGLGIALDDADEEKGLKTKVYLLPMKSEVSRPRLMNDDERQKWTEQFLQFGDYEDWLIEQIKNGVIEVQAEF